MSEKMELIEPVFDVDPSYFIQLKKGVRPKDISITLGFSATGQVTAEKKPGYKYKEYDPKFTEPNDEGLCIITLELTQGPVVGKKNYHLLEEQLEKYGAIQKVTY
ncbi:hypothetical protein KY332_01690 [Candidatus Woesearchaeota archaeon]|nr:hypothetical protein [Candidatus Woesearchaeota archaeon]